MAATISISLSQPISFLVAKPKPSLFFAKKFSLLGKFHYHHKIHNTTHLVPFSSKLTIKNWRINSAENFLLSEAAAETSEQILSSTGDDGVAPIISALLLSAFIGLSILTIGVIYIAVTDFLQKREKEKFEKEEATKKKKSGRKGKIVSRSRAGPRGFGQKLEEVDDDA